MFRKLFRKHMLIFLSALIFVVWILFCDQNSFINRRAVQSKIADLEDDCRNFKDKISADSTNITELKGSDINLERYARERYLMKKDNEDLYIIVE